MKLCNVKIPGSDEAADIEINAGIITNITGCGPTNAPGSILFENAIAFPGLINSHDHLDFNLFPQTANRVYKNYTEWGKDIQVTNKEMIRKVLKVPQELRTAWGVYKNLLNGFTTVVNHGERLPVKSDIITVVQNNTSLHSVQFEKRWKLKLNHPFKRHRPVVIHIGEGTDKAAYDEINELVKWNWFKRKIIGVHGVAMNKEQAGAFHALVWCPASNYFMLDATAPVDQLKTKTAILFGTDATLTASWNIWDQLRLARDTALLSDHELLAALTTTPAKIWRQNNTGSIAINQMADICIARANGKTGPDGFFNLNPEDLLLVMHRGNIRLFDKTLEDQPGASGFLPVGFSKIYISGEAKYVYGDLPALMKKIATCHPGTSFPISVTGNSYEKNY